MDEFLGSRFYISCKEEWSKCEFSLLQLVEDYDEFLQNDIRNKFWHFWNHEEISSADDCEYEESYDCENDEEDEDHEGI